MLSRLAATFLTTILNLCMEERATARQDLTAFMADVLFSFRRKVREYKRKLTVEAVN